MVVGNSLYMCIIFFFFAEEKESKFLIRKRPEANTFPNGSSIVVTTYDRYLQDYKMKFERPMTNEVLAPFMNRLESEMLNAGIKKYVSRQSMPSLKELSLGLVIFMTGGYVGPRELPRTLRQDCMYFSFNLMPGWNYEKFQIVPEINSGTFSMFHELFND